MPPKPRPHGKPKPPPPGQSRGLDRRLLTILAVVGAVLVAAVAIALAVGVGGGDDGAADPTAALEAAGCTLTTVEALPGVHSVATPEGTSKDWNTVPPTSGPHYEVPAIWGSYDEPVNQAQLVHNLEHGGIAIQFGDEVPRRDRRAARELRAGQPARHRPRAVSGARQPDRARRLGHRGRLEAGGRHRIPRKVRGASTRVPLTRSSTPTSSRAPSASRLTRSFPAERSAHAVARPRCQVPGEGLEPPCPEGQPGLSRPRLTSFATPARGSA